LLEAYLNIKHCVFCEIVQGKSPADILYEDDCVMIFRNKLKWVPVMLLAIPKEHMTQTEMWESPILTNLGKIAAKLGAEQCANGFRVLSNFGRNALQSQPHGHLHILGGVNLGQYA
jgi:histidine triad (HIT) family protein